MYKKPNFRTGDCNKGGLYNKDFYCRESSRSCCRRCNENNKSCPCYSNMFFPTFNPSITINVYPETRPGPIAVETLQYVAFAKEGEKIYTNKDALKQYGSSDILNPENVSNINLFINGVLQPPLIYEVQEGILHLKSNDLPPKDAPIILLFVSVTG